MLASKSILKAEIRFYLSKVLFISFHVELMRHEVAVAVRFIWLLFYYFIKLFYFLYCLIKHCIYRNVHSRISVMACTSPFTSASFHPASLNGNWKWVDWKALPLKDEFTWLPQISSHPSWLWGPWRSMTFKIFHFLLFLDLNFVWG